MQPCPLLPARMKWCSPQYALLQHLLLQLPKLLQCHFARHFRKNECWRCVMNAADLDKGLMKLANEIAETMAALYLSAEPGDIAAALDRSAEAVDLRRKRSCRGNRGCWSPGQGAGGNDCRRTGPLRSIRSYRRRVTECERPHYGRWPCRLSTSSTCNGLKFRPSGTDPGRFRWSDSVVIALNNASAPAPVLVDPLAAGPRPGTLGLSSSRSNSTSGLAQHIAHCAGPWSALM